jgi:tetraacyldisaccharide 4'-kinase
MIIIRNWCYDVGIFSITRVNVPVISVGNITVGGTGKTPMVEYLIRYFQNQNKYVAVVSRGYKRTSEGTVIMKAGDKERGSAESLGDEPYQIATKFPNVTVVVDSERARAAIIAEQNNADAILLDDGFQHRSLHRDLDVVMIGDGAFVQTTPMLPAGRRREPLSSLKRANVLVFNGKSVNTFFSKPQVSISYQPMAIRKLDGRSLSFEELKGKSCIAFCGIANPESFRKMLHQLSVDVVEWLTFPDHHRYSQSDVERVFKKYREKKADYILTTEKDSARLRNTSLQFPREMLYYVEIQVKFEEGEEVFHSLLRQTLARSVV